MGDQYVVGDRVFAKMKGYPPWPAKVLDRAAGKEEKYRILFYGTHDEAIVKLDQMYRYDEATKAKYGKAQRKSQFKEAMEEIEADLSSEEEVEAKDIADDSDGELMIDEGPPSLPPVLTREVNNKPDNELSKGKRPRTLSKRDSVSSASGTPVLAPAAATPELSQEPTTEIVSRSGRRIKPKRFADDEITTPVTAVGKAAAKASAAANASEEGSPPAKRPKRATKSITGKVASIPTTTTPTVAPVEEKTDTPPTRAAAAKGKGSGAAPVAPARQLSRLSPDIVSSPINSRGPPSLRAAPVRKSGSGNKQLPSLSAPSSTPKAPALRKSERKTRSQSIDEHETKNELPELLPAESEEIDDKENSETKPAINAETELNGESNDSTSVVGSRRRVPVAPAQKAPPPPEEQKIRVPGKNGLQYELSYDLKKPEAKNEEENKAWQAAATTNVDKLKKDLAQGEIESQEIINSTAETLEDLDIEEIKNRERRMMQIKLLRLEGEVIEIIGEIVGCLNVSSADCDRAIELLERLEGHQLNSLMLKKHPEVVDTIKRLRCYVGNVEAWSLDDGQKEQFEEKALAIRRKAVEIYKHFKDLFSISPEDSFIKVFNEEVERFKESVAGLSMKSVLGLTEVDETGELQEFDMEINGQEEADAEAEAEAEAEPEEAVEAS